MRFLTLETDYLAFFDWLYAEHLALYEKPFGEQLRIHTEAYFGQAGFCSSNLLALGHEAL